MKTLILTIFLLIVSSVASANISDLVMGDGFACAVRDDTTMDCWGNNIDMIDGLPIFEGVTDAAAIWQHACVAANQNVRCWGLGNQGQINVPVDLEPMSLVATSTGTSCGASYSGVRCWGQFAVNYPFGNSLTGIRQIEMEPSLNGYAQVCVLADQGVRCWSPINQAMVNPPQAFQQASEIKIAHQVACAKTSGRWSCWGNPQAVQRILQSSDQYEIGDFDNKFIGEYIQCKNMDGAPSCIGVGQGPRGVVGVEKVLVGPTAGLGDACLSTAEGIRCWGQTYSNPIVAIPGDLVSVNKSYNKDLVDRYLGCYLNNDGSGGVVRLQREVSAFEVDANGQSIELIRLQGSPVNAFSATDDIVKVMPSGEMILSSNTAKFYTNGQPSTEKHGFRIFQRANSTYSIQSNYGRHWNLVKSICP